MNDEKAAKIAKEIMTWILENTLKIEFAVTHASALDHITEIIEKS